MSPRKSETVPVFLYAINDKLQITGSLFIGVVESAFLYENGNLRTLGAIPGGISSTARAINNAAHICGFGNVPFPNPPGFVRHAFFWNGDEMIDIGVLPGAEDSFAYGINDHDQIVGFSGGKAIVQNAFIWRNGVMTNLNELISPDSNLWLRHASALNNDGQIAVGAVDINGQYVSVLLTPIPPVVGDVDCNQVVNIDDLLGVITNWAQISGNADLNGDGVVNLADLMLVIDNWS